MTDIQEARAAANGAAPENIHDSNIANPTPADSARQAEPAGGARRAALSYAARGWAVLPTHLDKRPLTGHGLKDAATDTAVIEEWWRRWPEALAAIATGARSGVVALDIDIRPDGSGIDTLETLGVTLPDTPMAHTPSGGIHCLFAYPGHRVPSSAGKIGAHVDVRGDGGYCVLPPGPGRIWVEGLGLDTPLAPMPPWMVPAQPEPIAINPAVMAGHLTRYGEKALDRAVEAILAAPNGTQNVELNRQCFGIGTLVGGGEIPAPLALQSLLLAARGMKTHDEQRPWRDDDLEKMVRRSFCNGLMRPRVPR